MADRPRRPSSLTKISIAFTKELIGNALARVKQLLLAGHARHVCIQTLDEEFLGLSKQMQDRLFDMASGKKIPDDFPKDDIDSMKAVDTDTFELNLKGDRPELVRGTIVRFMGGDWYVRAMLGRRLLIRRIV